MCGLFEKWTKSNCNIFESGIAISSEIGKYLGSYYILCNEYNQ